MQIHTLSSRKNTKKKRIGRGGKRGTYCGRGVKGQKARSGGNVDPLFEGGRSSLMQRLKKIGGFRSPHPAKHTVTLATLEQRYSEGDKVSLETLVEKGILRARHRSYGAKIVQRGELKKKLVIGSDIDFSEGAQKALEKAGCTFEEKENAS